MPLATFDSLIRDAMPRERHVTHGCVVTKEFRHNGDCYVLNPRNRLYVRVGSLPPGTVSEYETGIDIFWYNWRALRNAPFYRMAITDENLPATVDESTGMLLNHDPFFCREMMIDSLGRIGYYPACPDLREAMLHDLDWQIRGTAAKALGAIGDKGYTKDLIDVALNGSSRVREDALEGLGNMRDETAVPALRDLMEDEKRNYFMGRFTRDYRRETLAQHRMMQISTALKRIGGSAMRVLTDARRDENFWIRWAVEKGIEYSVLY